MNFNPQYPVLGLSACIIADDLYQNGVVAALDAFKTTWFGTAAQLTLRYRTVIKRTGPYSVLASREQMHAFEQDFAALVSGLPITVLAAVINK